MGRKVRNGFVAQGIKSDQITGAHADIGPAVVNIRPNREPQAKVTGTARPEISGRDYRCARKNVSWSHQMTGGEIICEKKEKWKSVGKPGDPIIRI